MTEYIDVFDHILNNMSGSPNWYLDKFIASASNGATILMGSITCVNAQFQQQPASQTYNEET